MGSRQTTRILVSSHDLRFLRPILNYWMTNPAYETMVEQHRFHEITEPQKCQEMLEHADVIFCEWCLGNAVWFAKHKKPCQKLIVRLHSQELRLPFLEQLPWDQVDRIIFICPLHQKLALERYPQLQAKSRLIFNPIDARMLAKEKLFGAEFNLGLLGMCPRLKDPMLAFDLLRKLKSIDPRYTLFIKGKRPEEYEWLMQRAEERHYYEKLYQDIDSSDFRNSVVFEGYGTDVAEWFRKIGFILSTSEREGSHQSVAEGMASGSLPIIRNWAGADQLYPGRFVFGKLDEAVELILKLKTVLQYSAECREVKQYAEKHFDQASIISQYDRLLSELYPNGDWEPGTSDLDDEKGESQRAALEPSTKRPLVAMHVCFLTPLRQNGYAIRVVSEVRALTNQGVEVIIACFISDSPRYPSAEATAFQKQIEESTGAKCYLLPTKNFFRIAPDATKEDDIAHQLIGLAQAHQVDIIHGQALYSTLHALRARQQLTAKVVFDVHGISPEEAEMSGASPLRVSTMAEWERRALQEADLRVFVSASMREHFLKKYASTQQLNCIVPCGVNLEHFSIAQAERARKRKEMGLEERFVILYLGTLSVWQWPEALFSVFEQFHRRRTEGLLCLLLPANDHELAQSYCQKHGLARDSYLLSEVPHQEVGLVAGVADAGLLLRKTHPVNAVSCPTKFGEYLAAGVPVVATEGIGDTSDLIRAENIGLVVSPTDAGLNAQDLERLLRFCEDVKKHRSDWSSRASLAAKRHLAWPSTVHTLTDKYRQLVEFPAREAQAQQPSATRT